MGLDASAARAVLARIKDREQDVAATHAERASAAAAAPPYVRAVAVHESTTRWVSRIGLASLAALVGLVAYQQYRIGDLVEQVRTKEFLVVPGAADFVPVRANLIPDRVVTEFVTYFTTQMISVTDGNIDRRYRAMSHFLAPDLEAKFDQELKRKAAVLRSLHGAEVFDALGEPEVQRLTVDGRTVFEAKVRGRVERYALGQSLESAVEVVTVTFRTRSTLGAEEPWVFEVVEFVRRTEDEQVAHERSRQVVQGGGR